MAEYTEVILGNEHAYIDIKILISIRPVNDLREDDNDAINLKYTIFANKIGVRRQYSLRLG